jgi:hypothetical protein
VILHQNKFTLLALNTNKPSVRLKNVASKIKLIGFGGASKDWLGTLIPSKYLRKVGIDLLYFIRNSFRVCFPIKYSW